MATVNGVKLIRNDGSETFDFKAKRVEDRTANGLVTDSVLSAARKVIGGKLVLEKETFIIEGIIKEMDGDQYPNSGTYSDNDFGFEREIQRAAKEWGYTKADGFDNLVWDGRAELDGILTEVTTEENVDKQDLGPGSYEFTVEFTYLDGYIS